MEHDILAFGQDLIAARPKLRQAAQSLAGRDAGDLVTKIMDDAWRERGQYRPGQDLLRRAAGEQRSFAED